MSLIHPEVALITCTLGVCCHSSGQEVPLAELRDSIAYYALEPPLPRHCRSSSRMSGNCTDRDTASRFRSCHHRPSTRSAVHTSKARPSLLLHPPVRAETGRGAYNIIAVRESPQRRQLAWPAVAASDRARSIGASSPNIWQEGDCTSLRRRRLST
jgi:hypothetical protein